MSAFLLAFSTEKSTSEEELQQIEQLAMADKLNLYWSVFRALVKRKKKMPKEEYVKELEILNEDLKEYVQEPNKEALEKMSLKKLINRR